MKRYEVGDHYRKVIKDNFTEAFIEYSLNINPFKYLIERRGDYVTQEDRILFNTYDWDNVPLTNEEMQKWNNLITFKQQN